MFFIGVDLGQKHDYSAIVVVEKENARLVNQARIWAALPPLTPKLLVRRVERIALGTPYPRIVERIHATTNEPGLAGRCSLIVDGTGVGAPVVDMLLETRLGCDLTAVTITGGGHQSRRRWPWISVPRRDLLSGVHLAVEKGHLIVARRMKESAALMRELLAIRNDSDSSGHDDLVLALALACWRSSRKGIYPGGRLPGF